MTMTTKSWPAASGAIALLLCVGLTACSSSDAPEYTEGACGPDGQVVAGNCAFTQGLDETASCPAGQPHRYDFDGITVCAEEEWSAETEEAFAEAGIVLPDPCASEDLPVCSVPLPQCRPDLLLGQSCDDGDACGNEIGDGCVCVDGAWDCYVHPHQFEPDVCYALCRPGDDDDDDDDDIDDGDICEGADLPECTLPDDECTFQLAGQSCDDGAACSNDVGDGCVCLEGTWECFVHPHLGPDDEPSCLRLCLHNDDPTDPCAGQTLPACPGECGPDVQPGGECDMEGDECGNNIGDGCTCVEGTWQCTIHPPLGMGCNLVCR